MKISYPIKILLIIVNLTIQCSETEEAPPSPVPSFLFEFKEPTQSPTLKSCLSKQPKKTPAVSWADIPRHTPNDDLLPSKADES